MPFHRVGIHCQHVIAVAAALTESRLDANPERVGPILWRECGVVKIVLHDISKRLHRRLASKESVLPTRVPKRRPSEPLPGNIKDVETLIKGGFDPIHAVYVYIQQISSQFAEGVSRLPEMKAYAKLAGDAEVEYLPSGPPMSPLTPSYFTSWAFYDLRFGRDGDTIGECQIDANDIFWLNSNQLEVLKKFGKSRMGIYEHVGLAGSYVKLRELLTDDEFTCLVPSGYRGRPGDLCYLRLLPPLEPQLASYHIAFTTPYILMSSKADWTAFLKRSLVQFQRLGEREALHNLLKHGPQPNYWNEFVFLAYHHHQPDAIYLAGIPDLRGTLPHAKQES